MEQERQEPTIADKYRRAEGDDYNEMCPEEPVCQKHSTFCHIVAGLSLALLIVAVATVLVMLIW